MDVYVRILEQYFVLFSDGQSLNALVVKELVFEIVGVPM